MQRRYSAGSISRSSFQRINQNSQKNKTKSAGFNRIRTKIIKEGGEVIFGRLYGISPRDMRGRSLESNIQTIIISPLYKKGCETYCSSYSQKSDKMQTQRLFR